MAKTQTDTGTYPLSRTQYTATETISKEQLDSLTKKAFMLGVNFAKSQVQTILEENEHDIVLAAERFWKCERDTHERLSGNAGCSKEGG